MSETAAPASAGPFPVPGLKPPTQRTGAKRRIGDVLWYLAQLATEAGLDLEQIAENNLEKLLSRHERGVLRGSGDDR